MRPYNPYQVIVEALFLWQYVDMIVIKLYNERPEKALEQ